MLSDPPKALNNNSANAILASKEKGSILQYFPVVCNNNREAIKRNLDLTLSTDTSECKMPKMTCTASTVDTELVTETYQSSCSNSERTIQSKFFNLNRYEFITPSLKKTQMRLATNLKDVQEDGNEILQSTDHHKPVQKEATYLPIIKCSATVPSVQKDAAKKLSWSDNDRSFLSQNVIHSTHSSLPRSTDELKLKTAKNFDIG